MIERILNIKTSVYASSLNEERIKEKIEDIFEQKTVNLVGKFTSQYLFSAYDKWTVIAWYLPNFKRKSAYLEGEIIKSEKGTELKLNFKPNAILSFFAILSVFIGIIATVVATSNKDNNQFLIIGLTFIAVGIIYYLIGMFLRNRLRNNFEKYLQLH